MRHTRGQRLVRCLGSSIPICLSPSMLCEGHSAYEHELNGAMRGTRGCCNFSFSSAASSSALAGQQLLCFTHASAHMRAAFRCLLLHIANTRALLSAQHGVQQPRLHTRHIACTRRCPVTRLLTVCLHWGVPLLRCSTQGKGLASLQHPAEWADRW